MAGEQYFNTINRAHVTGTDRETVRLVADANGFLLVNTDAASGVQGNGFVYTDPAFTAGAPTIHDVNDDLGRNGTTGYIHNTGAGEMSMETSFDGVVYGGVINVPVGGIIEFNDMSIDKIRTTWIANTSYQIVVY